MRHLKYSFPLLLLLSGHVLAQDNGVRTIAPLFQELHRVSSQPATAEAYFVADLGAMVSGQIEEVLVDIGDRVTRGEVLARINVPDVIANIESQRATIDALESEYERILQLVERNSMSPKSAEEARNRLDSALAEYKRIEFSYKFSDLYCEYEE